MHRKILTTWEGETDSSQSSLGKTRETRGGDRRGTRDRGKRGVRGRRKREGKD